MITYYKQCRCGNYVDTVPCYDCLKKSNELLRRRLEKAKAHLTEAEELLARARGAIFSCSSQSLDGVNVHKDIKAYFKKYKPKQKKGETQ